MYRGFKRDDALMNEVKDQFVNSKNEIIALVNSFKSEFDSSSEFNKMYKFMTDFFDILEDENKFNKMVIAKARTK